MDPGPKWLLPLGSEKWGVGDCTNRIEEQYP
jgi:hypothetical protein